jgi:hypothetical protein
MTQNMDCINRSLI